MEIVNDESLDLHVSLHECIENIAGWVDVNNLNLSVSD